MDRLEAEFDVSDEILSERSERIEHMLGEAVSEAYVEVDYGPHLEEVDAAVRVENYVRYGFSPGEERFDARLVKSVLKNLAGSDALADKETLHRFQGLSLNVANLGGRLEVSPSGQLKERAKTPHPVHRALNERPDFRGACTPGRHTSTEEMRYLMTIFYPSGSEYDEKVTAAKKICSGCSVREQCLEFALNAPPTKFEGVMGGTTARERKRIKNVARYDGVEAAKEYAESIMNELPIEPQ